MSTDVPSHASLCATRHVLHEAFKISRSCLRVGYFGSSANVGIVKLEVQGWILFMANR